MSAANQMLVTTQSAFELRDTMGLQTFRNAVIGDPRTLENNPVAMNAVQKAHNAWEYSFEELPKIAADETVMPVVRHENAAKVAKYVQDTMADAKKALLGQAEVYLAQGNASVDNTFAIEDTKVWRFDKIHDKIEELATKGAIDKIRDRAMADADYAKVIVNSKAELLDLAEPTYNSLRSAVIRKFAPEAQANFDSCDKLIDMTKHYDSYSARIAPAFYSEAVLSRISTRYAPPV